MQKSIQIFNYSNFLQFLLNPIKGFKVLYKILSDYPRIQKLENLTKSEKVQEISKYRTLVKKNKNLNFLFFGEKMNNSNNIYFSLKELKEKKQNIINSMRDNGIVVIEDVLKEDEINDINNIFQEINDNAAGHKITNASKIKYGNDVNDVEVKSCEKEISQFSTLNDLSDFFSKIVFGKRIKTFAEFYYHKSSSQVAEKQKFDTDTYYHLDRYLPCLKIIYSPEDINENSAPFCFLKGSHKLDNFDIEDFLIKNNIYKINESEKNNFKFEEQKLICKKNSLIVAFTNGFHKRNVFKVKNKQRKMVFFQYTNNFNKFSLYNYFFYNL